MECIKGLLSAVEWRNLCLAGYWCTAWQRYTYRQAKTKCNHGIVRLDSEKKIRERNLGE